MPAFHGIRAPQAAPQQLPQPAPLLFLLLLLLVLVHVLPLLMLWPNRPEVKRE